MNEVAYTHIPSASKFLILLPLGWIFYGGRYLIRMIRGKRPRLHLEETLEGAAARRKIYRKFRLFEEE